MNRQWEAIISVGWRGALFQIGTFQTLGKGSGNAKKFFRVLGIMRGGKTVFQIALYTAICHDFLSTV